MARPWKFREHFVGHPRSLRESPGFQALSTPARHALDFLELEHLRHGGQENGRLLAPYLQLETWGISSRDIRPALSMLEAFGVVRCTQRGERLGGRSRASLYALTFYPTHDGSLPTEDYRRVSAADVRAFFEDLKRRKAWKG